MVIWNEMQEKLQISDENAWQYCYYFYNYHLYSVLVRQILRILFIQEIRLLLLHLFLLLLLFFKNLLLTPYHSR